MSRISNLMLTSFYFYTIYIVSMYTDTRLSYKYNDMMRLIQFDFILPFFFFAFTQILSGPVVQSHPFSLSRFLIFIEKCLYCFALLVNRGIGAAKGEERGKCVF